MSRPHSWWRQEFPCRACWDRFNRLGMPRPLLFTSFRTEPNCCVLLHKDKEYGLRIIFFLVSTRFSVRIQPIHFGSVLWEMTPIQNWSRRTPKWPVSLSLQSSGPKPRQGRGDGGGGGIEGRRGREGELGGGRDRSSGEGRDPWAETREGYMGIGDQSREGRDRSREGRHGLREGIEGGRGVKWEGGRGREGGGGREGEWGINWEGGIDQGRGGGKEGGGGGARRPSYHADI